MYTRSLKGIENLLVAIRNRRKENDNDDEHMQQTFIYNNVTYLPLKKAM